LGVNAVLEVEGREGRAVGEFFQERWNHHDAEAHGIAGD
jgi:hypothetical protein